MRRRERELWLSKLGVILAVVGSAVGLGNFLRFPGLAAQYEGGVFLIPYFISLIFLGLPLAWAEWAMGRYGGVRGYHSSPGIFRQLWRSRLAPYVGVLGLLVPVGVYMFYVLIEAWCLGYFWGFVRGDFSGMGFNAEGYRAYFNEFTGAAADGELFRQGLGGVGVFLLICLVLNFWTVYRGVSRGIERVCLVAMPLLMLCAMLVLVRVLTLGTPDPARPELNVVNALGFMWNPRDFGRLLDPEIWMKAAGQIFFSLSVGFGVIITYASYLRRRDDVALSSTTAVAGNEFCEVVLGGLITVPAAFIFLGAAGASEALGSSFNLGFVTLPMVFAAMPVGQFFGAVFFLLLFLAAFTSSISMLQPAVAFFEEGLGLGRRAAVLFLGFITVLGNLLVMYFSKDFKGLDTIDFWVGTVAILALAGTQILLYGVAWGRRAGRAELDRGAVVRVPWWFEPVILYVSPIFLGLILVSTVVMKAGEYWGALMGSVAAQVTLGFVGGVVLLFLGLIHVAVGRWEREEAAEKGGGVRGNCDLEDGRGRRRGV
ncbi:MAG: sodium-dependent transporter [Methylacidiphilales bacterium]|nr:sodium-dependent transporter [Candidatus Methylacidiphilales bacterium]